MAGGGKDGKVIRDIWKKRIFPVGRLMFLLRG